MKSNMRVLFTEDQIRQRAKEIGQQIMKDYEGKEVILVGTLRGAVVWMADLMKEITMEDLKIDFIVASSYSGTNTTGVVKISKDLTEDVRIVKDLDRSIKDCDVIIVEDIVDTGITLNRVVDYIMAKGAESVEICSLLNKPSRRIVDISPKYCGFDVENLFVIGYGLDCEQKYRNLPYVAYIDA